MKIVSITEAKNRLSALIDGLRGGAGILIVDRGRPVARLEPIAGSDQHEGRLDRLAREGTVRAGRASLARSITAEKPPRPKSGTSVVAALIDERRDGR